MFLSCVGCQGGLDRGSGHRQRSGVRLPPTSHRCSPAIAGESLSPITGCQRQGSPLTGVHQLSQVSGSHQSQAVKGQCSPLTGVHQVSQVSGCHQSQVVKGQGSPLTSVHELSHASVTITGYQRAGFTTHWCSPAVTGESY